MGQTEQLPTISREHADNLVAIKQQKDLAIASICALAAVVQGGISVATGIIAKINGIIADYSITQDMQYYFDKTSDINIAAMYVSAAAGSVLAAKACTSFANWYLNRRNYLSDPEAYLIRHYRLELK